MRFRKSEIIQEQDQFPQECISPLLRETRRAIKKTDGGLPRICVSFWKKGLSTRSPGLFPSGCRIPWILWAALHARSGNVRSFSSRLPFLFMLAFYGSYGPDFLADVRPLSKLISVRLLFVPDKTTTMSRLARRVSSCRFLASIAIILRRSFRF